MKIIGNQDTVLGFEDGRIIPKDATLLGKDIQIQEPQIVRGHEVARVPCPSLSEVSEVTDCMLLSAAPAAVCAPRLGVTCVVNAAAELPDTPLGDAAERIAYIKVPLDDRPTADLLSHLDLVADTIEQVREAGGKTLVHCVAGVSRSAALCLAYLVKHERMPLRKAFAHLRSRRPGVRPNAGFFRQLIEYEQRVLGATTVSMVHNQAAGTLIPDVYVQDYHNTLWFQQRYNGDLGRH